MQRLVATETGVRDAYVYRDSMDKRMAAIESKIDKMIVKEKEPNGEDDETEAEESQALTVVNVRQDAAECQARTPYDPNDVYNTLLDPYARTSKDLETYVKEAAALYPTYDHEVLAEQFKFDFRHWTADHFDHAKSLDLTKIRNSLLTAGASVSNKGNIKLSKKLADFLQQLLEEDEKARKESIAKRQRKKPPDPSTVQPSVTKPAGTDLNRDGSSIAGETIISAEQHLASYRSRPSDVSKLFNRTLRYSGGPQENLRRRYNHFLDACALSGVDRHDDELMIRLISTVFVTGQAEIYFSKRIRPKVLSADETITALEKHFLDKRARRVNDEIWAELSFEFVKQKRLVDKLAARHEHVLNDLLRQIVELGDMRTSHIGEDDIMAKTLSAVRDVAAFAGICANPPDELQALHSSLRSRALEVDRLEIRKSAGQHMNEGFYHGIEFNDGHREEEYEADEEDQAYYIDRRLRYQDRGHRGRPTFRGYGTGNRQKRFDDRRFSRNSGGPSRRRIPSDVCIVCYKKGCHSSKHPRGELYKKHQTFLTELADAGIDEDDMQPSEDEEEGFAAFTVYATTARASAAMGVSPRSLATYVDAAMIDTGSSVITSIGSHLTTALRAASVIPTKQEESVRIIRGIGGSVQTLGAIKFWFCFGGRLYSVHVNVIPGDTPFILSHRDLDNMGLNYQSLFKIVERPEDGYVEPVEMRGNLPYLVFTMGGYFTETQLRNMHRNLGHPTLEKQIKVIENAGIMDLSQTTRDALREIIGRCKPCQLLREKPRRFLFSVKDDITGDFNHSLQADIVRLSDGDVLHVICMGTGFQQGTFVRNNPSSAEVWRALRRCWINAYAGAPDFLTTDAGTNFTSKEMREAAEGMGITIKAVPTEAHNRIGKVERSHAVLRKIYEKLKMDLPASRRDDRLSLSFRAINDAPSSPGGISPTMLVFGILPKIPGAGHRGSMAERANVVRQCTNLVVQMNAKRILRDSMRPRNVPSVIESEKVRTAPPGSKVIVYREKGGWTPYTLVRVRENEVDVILPSGKVSTFSLNSVRVFNNPTIEEETSEGQQSRTTVVEREPYMLRSRIRADMTSESDVFLSTNAIDYSDARRAEIAGLWEIGCFEVVDKSEADGHRLYRATFVDKTKTDGTRKSRLCVAACNDQEHGLFTGAPTVKRLSMRLLLALATSYRMKLWTRDVTQAFVQSKSELRRPVYMRPPKEMQVPSGQVVKVVKPLYGVPESPMHWYTTYVEHNKTKLGMKQIPIDPCLMFSRTAGKLSGILALQVDDTLVAGNEEFREKEEEYSSEFPNKGATSVGKEPVRFNGIDITSDNGTISIAQKDYLESIPKIPSKTSVSFEEFRSIRQKMAYAAYSTCPDALVFVARLSQFTESKFSAKTEDAMRILRKASKALASEPSRTGLQYTYLNPQKIEVVACIDAAFAVNDDKSSQLGIIVMLRDAATNHVNIVHYSSTKSKRVCKSVLAAELFALVDGFDMAAAVKDAVQRSTGRPNIPLVLYTDSQSLYGLCISLSQTAERRLQIDLAIIRQAYEAREITTIVWILGESNPADNLTKIDKRNGKLAELLRTNKFAPPAQAWIDRNLPKDENSHYCTTYVDKTQCFAKQKALGVLCSKFQLLDSCRSSKCCNVASNDLQACTGDYVDFH